MAQYRQPATVCKQGEPNEYEVALHVLLQNAQHVRAVSEDNGRKRRLGQLESYLLYALSTLPDDIEERLSTLRGHIEMVHRLCEVRLQG